MNFSNLTSSMLIQPVDYALVAWFALAALSTLYTSPFSAEKEREDQYDWSRSFTPRYLRADRQLLDVTNILLLFSLLGHCWVFTRKRTSGPCIERLTAPVATCFVATRLHAWWPCIAR